MKTFFDRAVMLHHPLRVLETFLEQKQGKRLLDKLLSLMLV